ncbi:calumenin-A [Centruroides vittatus]|uniref:calumenin-A n=1 Tax=Centruroides vittatus TaxID=120091 RepID=UPI00350F9F5B
MRPTSLVSIIFLCSSVICGPHTHNKQKDGSGKERESDGAYGPRDRDHFADEEHNVEFDHEAILGSKDEAETFDRLSPSEAKSRLKILAEKMDESRDGFIDKKELTDWILKSFRKLTEEEANEQMEDDDVNEDGRISWDEHKSETYGIYNDNELTPDTDENSDYQMLRNEEQLFKKADLNNDGYLDKSEFPAFTHPEEFEHMHDTLYEQTMQKKDKNKDGYLSLEEYVANSNGKVSTLGSEDYIVEKDRFDTDYDKNRDGKLSKEEVLLWLIPNNNDIAESEADHLIDSSDANKDGKLSIQEIVDHHEIFVGSEATDFGEHLHNTHKFDDEL